MKKVFLNCMLLLCALIVGSSNLWADTAGFTLTGKGGDGASGSISGASETWSYTATYSGTWYSAAQSEAWQVGKKSNACSSLVLSTSGISGTITQIDVSCGTQASKGSVNCTVGGNAFGTQGQSAGTGNNPANYGDTPSFTGSASGAIVVTINNTGTYISLKSITVTYSTSGGGSDPNISLSSTFVEATEEEKEGTINVTYNNIASVDAEVLFFAFDGTTPETYDWLDAEINTTDNTKLDYVIGANTGAARTAYMKVHQKNTDVYSSLITVSQAKKSVDNPEFNLETGSYWEGTNFTITSAGNTIYYTTDGTNPTNTSTKYTGAIGIIAGQKTYKAIAYDTYGNASNVVQRSYTGVAVATLPFSFNGKPNQMSAGFIQYGLGSYNTDPQIKFDGTDDYLLLRFDQAPSILSFKVKGNSFSGGTFKVQTSTDGINFSDLKSYTSLGDVQSESFSDLNTDVRYIKWIYTTKSNGNVGLGDIYVGKFVSGTISPIGWNTYANEYPLDLSTLTFSSGDGAAYYASAKDIANGVITLTSTTDAIPAGEGVMIQGEVDATFSISTIATGSLDGNLLVGTTEVTSVSSPYVLAGVENGKPYFQQFSGSEIAANKAYLPSDVMSSAAGLIRFVIENENDATDIDMIESGNKAVKFIENGRILILRDGITYDALGRKIR